MTPFHRPSSTPIKTADGKTYYLPTIVNTQRRPYEKTFVGPQQTTAGAAKRFAMGVHASDKEKVQEKA